MGEKCNAHRAIYRNRTDANRERSSFSLNEWNYSVLNGRIFMLVKSKYDKQTSNLFQKIHFYEICSHIEFCFTINITFYNRKKK